MRALTAENQSHKPSAGETFIMRSRITIVVLAAMMVSLLQSPLRAQLDGFRSILPVSLLGGPVADVGGDAKGGLVGDSYGGKGVLPHMPRRRMFRPAHYWVTAESLLWFGKGRTTPVLVTTSPQGTPQSQAGVLGESGTDILFGGGNVGDGLAAGARLDFGFWLDPCETLGVGAKVWGLQGAEESGMFTAANGDPILARPFYNVVLDQEDSLLISFPGLLDDGEIDVASTSDIIATEAYLRASIMSGRGYNLDLLGGYHFVRLDDSLLVETSAVNADPGGLVPVGTLFDTMDVFDARNEFHGGQVGATGEIRYDCWTLSGLAKVSFGNMHQVVNINGSNSVTTPGNDPVTTDGGLLAQPTNMSSTVGPHSRDETAIIPEVGFNVTYKWREHLRLTAGYSAIYWTNVVLAGDQIDRNINTNQMGGNPLIGPPLPEFAFRDTDYWLHGISLGVTWIH
jgi:hypothetical protein